VDYLVDSLLNPTSKIKEGYHTTFVTTKGGASYTGGIDSETGEVLVIRDALGALHRIPKAEIASKQISPISMMPAGLTANLREDEFIDLVRFLSELGKEGAYKLQPSNQIRAFTALLPHIRVRDEIGHYGPGIFTEPVKDYQWVPFYSQVNGLIPVGELPQQTGRGKDRLGVIRFDVPAGTDRGLGINDTAQVTLFSGKEPISLPPAGAATVPLKNGAGASFTLIVNVAARQSPLELRVVDGAEKPAKP
jgi:putative heme-binding domain-containing protein